MTNLPVLLAGKCFINDKRGKMAHQWNARENEKYVTNAKKWATSGKPGKTGNCGKHGKMAKHRQARGKPNE